MTQSKYNISLYRHDPLDLDFHTEAELPNLFFPMQSSPLKQWFDSSNGSFAALISEACERHADDNFEFDAALDQLMALLAEAEVDRDVATVAVLRNLRADSQLQPERIEKLFGTSVKKLYLGTLQLDSISKALDRGDLQDSTPKRRIDFSRILIAMVDDVRVIVIHLAELLVRMRQAHQLPESESRNLSMLVLSAYTPLANKLGIWRLKWELEDLSFKFLNRTEYDRIVWYLNERRVERENYVNQFVILLNELMEKLNIKATVSGRAKHLYGIWRKMNQKGLNFEDLCDVSAVRILVDDVAACYEALGAVHATWPSINDEFDDYIAMPKPNGYQSLHTAVIGPDSKVAEVQIRTAKMHHDCEFGVAAHWKYKENSSSTSYQDEKVALLRNLLDWKHEISGALELEPAKSQEVAADYIYVFTPAGNVVELPHGSTPIDFAYAIHTEVGHRCRGAKVNGGIVPLTCSLKTGDWVEIRTAKTGGPSRDWLILQNKFVSSARARRCIRRWFKHEEYGRYLAQGKAVLEKELARHHIAKVNMDKLAADNGFQSSSDFFTAIGLKELKPFHAISGLIKRDSIDEQIKEIEVRRQRTSNVSLPTLSIQGVSNLLTSHASCCRPLPGDDVTGYVTVTRGITIHKSNCNNIKRMLADYPDRRISVSWENVGKTRQPIEFTLEVEGHPTLLQDISNTVDSLGLKISAVNIGRLKVGQLGKIHLTVEIGSADELRKVLRNLSNVDRVLKVSRNTD